MSVLVLAAAGTVVACGARPTPAPVAPPSVVSHADVVLHVTDLSRTVTVHTGAVVAVELGSLAAGRPFISSWHRADGTSGPVLEATAGGFRAVGLGDASLVATSPCRGTGCAAAVAWSAHVRVR